MKGKSTGIIGCMGKVAASVLLTLFINGNERCHTLNPYCARAWDCVKFKDTMTIWHNIYKYILKKKPAVQDNEHLTRLFLLFNYKLFDNKIFLRNVKLSSWYGLKPVFRSWTYVIFMKLLVCIWVGLYSLTDKEHAVLYFSIKICRTS